jgi:hypothetical protein
MWARNGGRKVDNHSQNHIITFECPALNQINKVSFEGSKLSLPAAIARRNRHRRLNQRPPLRIQFHGRTQPLPLPRYRFAYKTGLIFRFIFLLHDKRQHGAALLLQNAIAVVRDSHRRQRAHGTVAAIAWPARGQIGGSAHLGNSSVEVVVGLCSFEIALEAADVPG